VKVHFATNRNPFPKSRPTNFGERPNDAGIDELRFGEANVEERDGSYTVKGIEVYGEKVGKDGKLVLGSQQCFDALRANMKRGRDTMAFVHGYNTTFDEALGYGARLAKCYGGPNGRTPLVFSWPSDGQLTPFIAYRNDRIDARSSGEALARFLLKFRDFINQIGRGDECGAEVVLFAHSMGNYVLRNGLQAYLKLGLSPTLQPLFKHVFLMAADEDQDAFEHEHKLKRLPELGDQVHVYFNRDDTALIISDKTKQNPTRLGTRGPQVPHAVPGNVNLVDVSEVLHDIVEHNYFIDSGRVVRDAAAVLRGVPSDQIAKRRYVTAQNRYVLER
jgi:esterase/lipase superfamily enzyme